MKALVGYELIRKLQRKIGLVKGDKSLILG